MSLLHSKHFIANLILNIFQRPTTANPRSKLNQTDPRYNDMNFSKNALGNIDRFEIGTSLGQGSYAVVKLAKDTHTNKQVAIKIYEKFRLIDPQKRMNLKREINILEKLDHPNIIKLYMTIDTRSQVC